MNRARRLTPTVHVHKQPWAPWAWTYSLDGKESDVYHLTRQAALLEAQQEANRVGFQRRKAKAIAAGRSKEKTVSGEILGALGLRPVPRTRVRTWVRR